MRLNIVKSANAEQLYIIKSFRKEDGKSTTRIFKKLGTMASLLPLHDNDRDKVISWAKEQARIYTEAEKNENMKICLELSEGRQLTFDEINTFDGGYLFLQKLFYDTGLADICDKISSGYDFKYDLAEILSNLTCSRILSPSSKLSSFEYMHSFIEKPSFSLHDIYRALDVLDRESDSIQSMLYEKSRGARNTSVLYYDCTNFFFEIEEEKGLRKYGKSKEHRPNPIVNMGLFLDGDGIPLAFTIFSGNGNEQPTLIPLEKKILNDFRLSKFIICTDAGLASNANRKFNSRQDRSYVVTQPLKKLKEHIRKWALDTKGFHLDNSSTEYDISDIDEHLHKDSVFFKERWVNEDGIEQRLIVSYCPKHRMYQREVRNRQIERAEKIIEGGKRKCRRNQNSPERFIEQLQIMSDGQIAETTLMQLNGDRILQEEQYDGFYAVCTNLEGDVNDIIRINRRRWEIEDSFRLMKSEFQARPVYLQNDARIRAHFMTCFISLTLFRILEKRLGGRYTASEIITALRSMKFQRIQGVGYIPCYTRTAVTDSLHEAFGFRTDREIITMQNMKKILRETKR